MSKMLESAGPFADSRPARFDWIFPSVVGLIGLVMIHHPMLFSGLNEMQVDACDTRLINYTLEHSFRWTIGHQPNQSLWDPPFFYPARNLTAYSDTMLGVAPIYWAWRACGFMPDTAFQLWMISLSFLNYVAGSWLFRRGFRRSLVGSTAGAFLFAFAAVRANQLAHQQLLSQVYVVATLMALIRIFERPVRSWFGAFSLWSTAGLSVVAQLYAAFYVGWFLVFALAIATFWGLVLADFRKVLLAVLKAQWLAIFAASVVTMAGFSPLLIHCLRAMGELGLRQFGEISTSVPGVRSWFYLGEWSWLWAWTGRLPIYYDIGLNLESAQRVGIGMVTPFVCVVGLALYWNNPAVRLTALTGIGMLVAVTRIERAIVDGVAVGLLLVSLLVFQRSPLPAKMRWAIGGMIAFLGLGIFPVETLERTLVAATIVFLASLLLRGRAAIVVRAFVLAGLMGFLCLTSYSHRPRALFIALAVIAAVEASRRLTNREPAPRYLLIWGGAVGISLFAFTIDVNWWLRIINVVPGAMAIRAVSRGLMFAVIPAALGLACFFDFGRQRRKYKIPLSVLGFFCLMEQGITTPSYDKHVKRAQVSELAGRIDRGCATFYYSPSFPLRAINHYHLDAMWAGLELDMPSISGYSGSAPPGWQPLYSAAITSDADIARLDRALRNWAIARGLGDEKICWIVGNEKQVIVSRTGRAKGAAERVSP
jgi:hypothetical protein